MARLTAHLSKQAFLHNIETLSQRAFGQGMPARILFPVKANAYGHGLLEMAHTAEPEREIWGFAVATADEAFELREGGIQKPILLLTPAEAADTPALHSLKVRLTISSATDIDNAKPGTAVHLKINTGLNRLGARPQDISQLIDLIDKKGLLLEGIFSHFACADDDDPTSAEWQLHIFEQSTGAVPPQTIKHISNSAGVFRFGPRAAFDLIRPGIALYGYAPNPTWKTHLALQPVLTLKARIAHIQHIQPGESVSYGALWTAQKPTQVAVISVGYGDGYPRNATKAHIEIQGAIRPILGRICMDQMMADATDLNIHVGDFVTLWGPNAITATEVAKTAHTSDYEILTRLDAKRVRRLWVP